MRVVDFVLQRVVLLKAVENKEGGGGGEGKKRRPDRSVE